MGKQKKLKSFISGSQIFFHYCRMLTQMNKTIGKWVLTIFIISTLIFLFFLTPGEVWRTVYYVVLNKFAFLIHLTPWHVKPFFLTYDGNRYYETIDTVGQAAFITQAKSIFKYLFSSALLGAICSIGAYIGLTHWLTKKGFLQRGEQFVRGSKKVSLEKLKKIIEKKEIASDLKIEGLPLIKNSEWQHIAVHGTTGVGKSQLIMQLLDQLKERKDETVIIMDQGCTYTSNYFDSKRGDRILNPADERCAAWDLWAEAKEITDFEDIAAALMPQPKGNTDPVWVNGARTIFSEAAYRMRTDSDRCIAKLNFLLLKAPFGVLEKYLSGTQAASNVSSKTAKLSQSFRSTLQTYIKSFRFLEKLQGKPFSIREWMKQKEKGWLFISTNELHAESFRPLMSMWLAQATQQLLSLEPDNNRRIWFIVDELACYHHLKQLVNALPRARKFGGCFVIGLQAYAQLQNIYGVHGAKELFDLLNTRFFFRSKSSEVADFVSRELGEQEIKEFRENMSYGADTIRDGVSSGHYKTKRRIVYYPEILELPDLTCFVQLPQSMPISDLKLTYQARKKIALGYEKKDHSKHAVLWEPPAHWLDTETKTMLEQKIEIMEKIAASHDCSVLEWMEKFKVNDHEVKEALLKKYGTAEDEPDEKEKLKNNEAEKKSKTEKSKAKKKTKSTQGKEKKTPENANTSADKPKENEMSQAEMEMGHD